jgi:hypothetical protein
MSVPRLVGAMNGKEKESRENSCNASLPLKSRRQAV